MTKSVKDFIANAEKSVTSKAPAEAHADATANRALILDVREAAELEETGKPKGSIHVPRGVLEFHADPQTASAQKQLTAAKAEGRPVHVLCASGKRALLAAHTLTEMGYHATVIEGGMAAWKEAGLETS